MRLSRFAGAHRDQPQGDNHINRWSECIRPHLSRSHVGRFWPDWAFSMRAHGAAIDVVFHGVMELLRVVAPALVTTLGVPEQNVARQLFFMLAMMTKGPALAIARQAEISGGGPNGLEAWRFLVRLYEPEAATRTLGLLQQILNPVPFPDNMTGFEEALSFCARRFERGCEDCSPSQDDCHDNTCISKATQSMEWLVLLS